MLGAEKNSNKQECRMSSTYSAPLCTPWIAYAFSHVNGFVPVRYHTYTRANNTLPGTWLLEPLHLLCHIIGTDNLVRASYASKKHQIYVYPLISNAEPFVTPTLRIDRLHDSHTWNHAQQHIQELVKHPPLSMPLTNRFFLASPTT